MTIAEEAAGAKRPFEESFAANRQLIIDRLKEDGEVTFMFLPWGDPPITPAQHTDGSKWFDVHEIYRHELDERLRSEGLKTAFGTYKVRTILRAYL